MTDTAYQPTRRSPIDWQEIDTVFLDMDGTLLDLRYDNRVWNEMLPRAYAQAHDLPLDDAKNRLLSHMREIWGTIRFYSFDYWTEFTQLDLVALHASAADLIEYRPGALDFLRWSRKAGKQVVIATNAHRSSVAIKEAAIALADEVDAIVSSQDFETPKEELRFWERMQDVVPFHPERAFFADDNQPVLDSARDAGIAHLWTIITPDSDLPPRTNLNYPEFDDFAELY